MNQQLVAEYFEHRDGKLYWKKAMHPSKQYLRPATRSENQCNRGAIASNTSGYSDVSWHKHSKAWYVRVMKDGKSKIIGYFKDLELAGLVSAEARSLYHGAYAKSN